MVDTTYDHQIVAGTATTRLLLAKDQNDKPLYTVHEDPLPHQTVLSIEQREWLGGHGQYTFGDKTMYFDGQSIDTTQEGRIILGPKINEVYETAASVKDSYITGDDSSSSVRDANWSGQTFTAGSSYTLLSVRLKLWRAGNPGTATVSIYATAAGLPTGSALSTGTTDGNTLPVAEASAEWRTITMSAYSIVSGTAYAVVVSGSATAPNYVKWRADTSTGFAGGKAVYTANSGTSWTASDTDDFMFEVYGASTDELDTAPVHLLWASTAGKLLCATAGKVYYLATGGTWTAATTTIADCTDICEFNGVVYAAKGNSVRWYYSTDGDTWTQTDLTDGYAVKFMVAPNAAGTTNVLWCYQTANELLYTTDGRTVAAGGVQLSTPAYIGDTTSNIQNLFMCADDLLVGRADNLFHYDNSGGIHALMDELKNARSAQNFKYVINWHGASYFTIGQRIYELTGGSLGVFAVIDPLVDTGDIDKVGICVGLTSDTDYIYAAYLEGTVTHIYKGKPIGNRWSWCPWVYLSTNQCEAIYLAQHSATDKRLWFGYGTHTGYVQVTDNPTADAMARFAPTGTINMSWIYGTNPYWDKMFQSVVIETVGVATTPPSDVLGRVVQPKYITDATSGDLTALVTSSGVVSANLTTPITAKRIKFILTLTTDDSTKTPQVRQFIAKGRELPQVTRVHDCVYQIQNIENHRVENIRAALRTARASSTLIKFADNRYGDTTAGTAGTDYVYVTMMPGYPKEVDVKHLKGQPPELGISVRWLEANYS